MKLKASATPYIDEAQAGDLHEQLLGQLHVHSARLTSGLSDESMRFRMPCSASSIRDSLLQVK